MNRWKRAVATVALLSVSLCGVSLAAPGGKPAAGKAPAAPSREVVAARRAETLMVQLKMTEDQKKRARKAIAETQAEMKRIDQAGGTDQQKQQKAIPVMEKLRTTMDKIMTPAQRKQLEGMKTANTQHASPAAAPGVPRR